MTERRKSAIAAAVLGALLAAQAAAAREPDLEKGKEINGVCAACHGAFG